MAYMVFLPDNPSYNFFGGGRAVKENEGMTPYKSTMKLIRATRKWALTGGGITTQSVYHQPLKGRSSA